MKLSSGEPLPSPYLSCKSQEDNGLPENGFLCNHACALVGSGLETYKKVKRALQDWRHFGMNWDQSKDARSNGVRLCVCVKELLSLAMMPLQIVYVNENKQQSMTSFCLGGGTFQGHLLSHFSWFLLLR
ncbi:hypothetical protein RchiOBHm_Chr5g0036401 [Rosa chinensis]|uniref:DUF1990 domain-containing protein n=1 Tax=Rosa chinensis TaxID=74649 RepID=A0A2P6QBH5_ROSCH|nr:hypothetical protein RchiOBHm_Chr5g0036401 [Rosa chinensis]